MDPRAALRAVKLVHTLAWAIFAGAILAVPIFLAYGDLASAWWLIGLVAIEVAVLLANGMRCPLTDVAARYTTDRRDNFDIYLPLRLARYNKRLFGPLYLLDVVWATWATLAASG